jgi:hypothetical protein
MVIGVSQPAFADSGRRLEQETEWRTEQGCTPGGAAAVNPNRQLVVEVESTYRDNKLSVWVAKTVLSRQQAVGLGFRAASRRSIMTGGRPAGNRAATIVSRWGLPRFPGSPISRQALAQLPQLAT